MLEEYARKIGKPVTFDSIFDFTTKVREGAVIKWLPNKNTKALLGPILDIVKGFSEIQMTLRQLFYQLVSGNRIPNSEGEYKRVSRILTKAREAGLVDWDYIVDRNREYSMMSEFQSINELVDAARLNSRLSRWQNQPNYVEVLLEKDALSGIVQPICDKWHVGLLVNRGYGSATVIHDMAERMRQAETEGKRCIVYYLGDHDPSGLDMEVDVRKRLEKYGANAEVIRLGLNLRQVAEFHLPPNPAKLKDSRAKGYVKKYGNQSYELDALPPQVLVETIEKAILSSLDMDLYNKCLEREKAELAKMEGLA